MALVPFVDPGATEEALEIALDAQFEERKKRVVWMNKTLAERAKVQRYRTSLKRLVKMLREGPEDDELARHKAAAWLDGLITEDEANKTHQIGEEP